MCDCGDKGTSVSSDLEVWLNRWCALKKAIQDTLDSFNRELPKADKDQYWATTLRVSLESLRDFGQQQVCFFIDGFNSENLAESPDFRKEFALRRTLDQIAFDLTVMQQIRGQRVLGSELEREALETADKLAYKALRPAIEGELLANTAVLTYLQKAANVRVVPYAPVAFIGIPRTAIGAETTHDLLATVHEVGHYVFWHSKVKNGKETSLQAALRLRLPQEPAWRLAWLEEIFADVYGAVIAGPVLALGLQDVLFDNLNLLENDLQHPQPVIRPYIYSETLRQLRVFPDAAKELDGRWEKKLQKRALQSDFRPKILETDMFKDIQTYLQETIADILSILQPLSANRKDSVWSTDTDDLDNLYGDFKKSLEQPEPSSSEEVRTELVVSDTPPVPIAWHPGESRFRSLEFLQEAQNLGLKLPPGLWTRLLDVGGWSTSGPEGDGSPK